MSATVRRRPRRTAKAIAERATADWEKPTKLQPTPEMLTVEYLKPLVDSYQEAKSLHEEWKAKQLTPTGKRKKGKELENALALPEPPYPPPPMHGYGRLKDTGGVSKEVLELWSSATGHFYIELMEHPKWDENTGMPLNREAELAEAIEEQSRRDYLNRAGS
jgi:hypothetical protein